MALVMRGSHWGMDFPSLQDLHRKWAWFFALGVGLMTLGILAIGWSFQATLGSVIFIGWLLFFGGLIQIAHSFSTTRWDGFFLHLLGGILQAVVGVIIFSSPAVGALSLTLLFACLFLAGGTFRMSMAFVLRFPRWGLSVFSGLIDILLGILILAQWPSSSAWVLGLFVGINLLVSGGSTLGIALALKKLPETPSSSSG